VEACFAKLNHLRLGRILLGSQPNATRGNPTMDKVAEVNGVERRQNLPYVVLHKVRVWR
jgi:hypothetical protein